jgi:predicted alpha/beta superfamily hydrolase
MVKIFKLFGGKYRRLTKSRSKNSKKMRALQDICQYRVSTPNNILPKKGFLLMKHIFLLLLFCLSLTIEAQIPVPAKGRIVRHADFPSRYVPARHVDVWLPEGYTEEKRYAVLYMHDGQMLFDGAMSWNKQEWNVELTMDSLRQANAIRDCIVVGIWNTPRRRTEYFPAKAFFMLRKELQDTLRTDLGDPKANPESDPYLQFIVTELKPFVDKTYATKQGRTNTFIAGSSMGGLISMYALCEYPKVFGGAACLSTHWPGSVMRNNPEIAEGFNRYLQKNLPRAGKHRWYFDFGTKTLDAWYEPYQLRIDQTMRDRGYKQAHWMTRKYAGADHSEAAWQRRLHEPLGFLLRK